MQSLTNGTIGKGATIGICSEGNEISQSSDSWFKYSKENFRGDEFQGVKELQERILSLRIR